MSNNNIEKSLQSDSQYYRNKILYIINTIQANQLFVHSKTLDIQYMGNKNDSLDNNNKSNKQNSSSETKKKGRPKKKKEPKLVKITKKLPEILTLCVLNALVPNSAMLLIGGHGGGKTSIVKYLGRMFTGISLADAEEGIIRGHPQLTEEKIIGTLDIKKLMKDGIEEVHWRSFAINFWKIIDEVNRCSPYTQNILLSLLAEGKIKYYDSVLNVSKYCLYATLNPQDVGTFEMSAPFLDRFGISVPISMPKSQDLAIILESDDEKLGGYDELVQVPAVLTEQQLLSIWYLVSSVPVSQDAENFIHAIIREFTLCSRIDKGNSEFLKPSTGLCNGCHYAIPEKIPCSNSDTILSVRVAKDLLRYARALTWLLGAPQVEISIIMAIAPYVIAHRVSYQERFLNKNPYWGNKYEFTAHLLEIINKRYQSRKKAYELVSLFRDGLGTKEDLKVLKDMSKSDLIVEQDLYPLAKQLLDSKYQNIMEKIKTAEKENDVNSIAEIRRTLLLEMDFPNRGDLITRVNRILRILTLHTYNCSLSVWNSIRITIDGLIPQFSKKLRETVRVRSTYRLRTEDLDLEINITGTEPDDVVNFSFYGGDLAEKLNKMILEIHGNALKTQEEILAEAEKKRQEAFGGFDVDSLRDADIFENKHEKSDVNISNDDSDSLDDFEQEFFDED